MIKVSLQSQREEAKTLCFVHSYSLKIVVEKAMMKERQKERKRRISVSNIVLTQRLRQDEMYTKEKRQVILSLHVILDNFLKTRSQAVAMIADRTASQKTRPI